MKEGAFPISIQNDASSIGQAGGFEKSTQLSPPHFLLSHGYSQPDASLCLGPQLWDVLAGCSESWSPRHYPHIISTWKLQGGPPQSRSFRLTHLGAHSNSLTYLILGCSPQLLGVSCFLLRHCPHPQLCSPSQGQGSLILGSCPAVGLRPQNQLPCPSWPCLATWSARTQVLASLWPLLPRRSSASAHWLL